MKNAKHWSEEEECTSPLGVRILYGLYRTLGRLPFWFVTVWVVLWFRLTDRRARDTSMAYLQHAHAYGLIPKAPTRWTSFLHTFQFADTILDKFVALWGDGSAPKLTIEDDQLVFDAIKGGRGCVILCSHMGCTEALMHHGSARGERPIIALVHTANTKRFNETIRRSGSLKNLTFMEVEKLRDPASVYALDEAVENGALVFIAGDRTPVHGDSHAVCPLHFLGREACFPSGGVMLANLFHAPLLTMTSWREESATLMHPNRPSRYHVRFRLLSGRVSLPRKNRQEAAAELLQGYVDELEHALRESPMDWFNFYDFWRRPGVTEDRADNDTDHNKNNQA